MGNAGAIFIGPGDYDIGSEDVPNAGPKHVRRLTSGFWIDCEPVKCRHFEDFVTHNGFLEQDNWDSGGWQRRVSNVPSVDERCHQVRQLSEASGIVASGKGLNEFSPVTGLNWFEAYAICRHSAARLPFEIEWEIAMKAMPTGNKTHDRFEEWTLDVFSAQFWRADFTRRGVPWTESQLPVTVRGSGPTDIVRHVAVRRGRAPEIVSQNCGFRRVWETEPPRHAFLIDR